MNIISLMNEASLTDDQPVIISLIIWFDCFAKIEQQITANKAIDRLSFFLKTVLKAFTI